MVLQSMAIRQSRRNWLRHAAVAATGAVVLPSLLVGCTDHDFPVEGDPGTLPLTDFALLNKAATNIKNMLAWYDDVYSEFKEYENVVFSIISAGTKPNDWTGFIVNSVAKIVTGLFEAATAEIPGVGAAFALAANYVAGWITGEPPQDLKGVIAEFLLGQYHAHRAISDHLLLLTDVKNLQAAWNGQLSFMGKTYTLKDLATTYFPTKNDPDAYVAMRTAALDSFNKHLWNMMFIKAGHVEVSYEWSFLGSRISGENPAQYGVESFYYEPENASRYLRGYYDSVGGIYYFRYWYFTFDGLELNSAAAKELFKDDIPNHITNPGGLFFRDYAFKQFQIERNDFKGYHQLTSDISYAHFNNDEDFNVAEDNFIFTGGDFPELVRK